MFIKDFLLYCRISSRIRGLCIFKDFLPYISCILKESACPPYELNIRWNRH